MEKEYKTLMYLTVLVGEAAKTAQRGLRSGLDERVRIYGEVYERKAEVATIGRSRATRGKICYWNTPRP